MNIQATSGVASKAKLTRPQCPRCGSIVLMAARAAFNPSGRIRHTWSCEECAHEFVTSISMVGASPDLRPRANAGRL